MSRAKRRYNTERKFISRLKKWYRLDSIAKQYESWKEFLHRVRWAHMLKHGKLYGRSTMNNVEKHISNKKVREESKQLVNEATF